MLIQLLHRHAMLWPVLLQSILGVSEHSHALEYQHEHWLHFHMVSQFRRLTLEHLHAHAGVGVLVHVLRFATHP